MTIDEINGELCGADSFPLIVDWELAYSNRRAVPDVLDWLERSAQDSAEFVSHFRGGIQRDLAYGAHPRERVDLFEPERRALGTLVFIHGGYWRASSKESHWHFGQGMLERGWRVAHVEYPLCPQVAIRDIADSTRRAVDFLADRIPSGPIMMVGHSAGGHLATWLASDQGGLRSSTRDRINRVVSLSGLHDLRPLVQAQGLNADLKLDPDEAQRLSPVFARPARSFDLLCIAGGHELSEFRRQNRLLANLWSGLGVASRAVEIRGANHYTLLDHLRNAASPMVGLMTSPL
jgi:arylformamidase